MVLELSCIIIQQYISLWNYNCIQAVEKGVIYGIPRIIEVVTICRLFLIVKINTLRKLWLYPWGVKKKSQVRTYLFLSTNMMQVDWLNSGIIYSKVTSELHLLIALDMLLVSIFIQRGYIILNSMWNYS
jgi:hypothetical protein